MNQSQILEIVNKDGSYSASLYKFQRSTRGINDVRPAQKLAEKGILKLINQQQEIQDGVEIIHFTWIKA